MVGETETNPMTTLKTELPTRSAMTPVERLHGRFMRAPDHDAGTGGEGGADGASGEGDQGAGEGGDEGSTDTSILGGDADEGKDEGEGVDDKGGEAEDADKAAKDDAPAVPEAYELTPPEGFEKLDEESLAAATPIFKELGLTNDQANKLMPVAGQFAKRIQDQQQAAIMDTVVKQRADWAKEAKSDPEIGGAKFKETTELAAKALDALGYVKGSPFRSFLTDSGLGNHPEMIRAMRKVGELVSENGDFVHGDAATRLKPDRLTALYPDDVPKEGAN